MWHEIYIYCNNTTVNTHYIHTQELLQKLTDLIRLFHTYTSLQSEGRAFNSVYLCRFVMHFTGSRQQAQTGSDFATWTMLQ